MSAKKLFITDFFRSQTEGDDDHAQPRIVSDTEGGVEEGNEPVSAEGNIQGRTSPTMFPVANNSGASPTLQEHGMEDGPSDEPDSSEGNLQKPTSPETVKESCQCPCCLLEPHQPADQKTIDKTTKIYGKGKKQTKRCFLLTWYEQYPWLALCSTQGKTFCNICKTAHANDLLTFSSKVDDAFIKNGFNNWKKASSRFKDHESSGTHREALMKVSRLNSKEPDVHTQLNTKKQVEQQGNRNTFLTELSCIRMLARQGIALRGHVEEEGNLYQLMKSRAEDDVKIEKWLKDSTYMSHDSVNEIANIMGNSILRKLIEEIKEAGYYAVLADETRDTSNKEQFVICIRWVDAHYSVLEEPIGMFNVPQTDAATILAAIKDVLLRCSLPIEKCRGQGYDGASNMMGRLNGVATKIKEEEPAALIVHCLAHSANLVLQDACKKIKPLCDALNITREISRLIKFSPKREILFAKNQISASGHLESGEVPSVGPRIKPLCPTRWTVRTAAIDAILKNYSTLRDTMREVNATQHDDNGMAAGGVAALMDNFQTYWGLKLAYLLFSAAEELSRSLQGKDTSAQEAHVECKSVQQYYQKLRTDELEFEHLYEGTVTEAAALDINPTLPRYRKRPKRFDDGNDPHRFENPKQLHKQEYVESLELVIQQLETRFDQRDFATVCDIETTLIAAANGKLPKIPASVNTYNKDIDLAKLEIQLRMLPQFIQATDMGIKEVTSMRTIADALNSCQIGRKMLSEVATLLQIYFTIPVTTATAERSFSLLRRLKTWLRGTMTQERLNNLLMIHAHKLMTDSLSLPMIAEEFASANDRRKLVFGSFKC